ncbi:MAG: nucleotide pyrophosphohydrolase [Nitrospirota bacterium]|nr:MAG: nucleotide pyrophosphohydrolase [Nitrospirota bacterium]
MNGDLTKVLDRIKRFRDARDWMQFHDPKNMAISIIIEASELLEHFQWKKKDEVETHIRANLSKVEEEIADIAIYLFELADNLGIDITEAMNKKITKNEAKYPVESSKGNAIKYDQI